MLKHTVTQKASENHRAQGVAPTISLALGANPRGKKRVRGNARRIQISQIGSALVYVRQNAHHRELKPLDSARFVLITVVMVAVSTCGPIGYPVSPPTLLSQNKQSQEKSSTSQKVRGETQTTSLALGANREGRERVKGKASRIQSSRIGSALVCVRRNVPHRELKLPEST